MGAAEVILGTGACTVAGAGCGFASHFRVLVLLVVDADVEAELLRHLPAFVGAAGDAVAGLSDYDRQVPLTKVSFS